VSKGFSFLVTFKKQAAAPEKQKFTFILAPDNLG
jgi:hypothetical protein